MEAKDGPSIGIAEKNYFSFIEFMTLAVTLYSSMHISSIASRKFVIMRDCHMPNCRHQWIRVDNSPKLKNVMITLCASYRMPEKSVSKI